MNHVRGLIPGFIEVAEFGAQAAKAAAILAEVRDENVHLAPTPKEEVWRLGSKLLHRLKFETPRRVVQAPHSAMPHPNFVPAMPSTSRNTTRAGCHYRHRSLGRRH